MSTEQTGTTSQPRRLSHTRARAIAAFYAEHAANLQHALAGQLRAPAPLLEDACQTAWTILIRRPDIPLDRRGLAWLRKVALTTGYAISRREQPAGDLLSEPDGLDALTGVTTTDSLDRLTEQLDRRQRLQDLTARQRRYLGLQAIGLSYSEIAARENTTERTVERQVLRARRRLREQR